MITHEPMTDTQKPPSLKRRLACLMYELLLMAAILLVTSAIFLPLKHELGAGLWLVLFRLCLLGALFAYFGLSWVHGGQTVAMKAWRLKLVSTHAPTVGWGQASFRFVVALVLFIGVPVVAYLGMSGDGDRVARLSLLWCFAPYLWSYFDPQGQYLHDRLCGTRLILLAKRPRPGARSDNSAAQAPTTAPTSIPDDY